MKVKALWDFSAAEGSQELDIVKDEIIEVLNTDIDKGWWEGINSQGKRGLFPAQYVEAIEESGRDQSINEAAYQTTTTQSTTSFPYSAGGHSEPAYANAPSSTAQQQHQTSNEPGWPDEDWDDDDDDSSDNATDYAGPSAHMGQPAMGQQQMHQSALAQRASRDLSDDMHNMNLAPRRAGQQTGGPAKTRRNFAQFSTFSKSGLEAYILEGRASGSGARVESVPSEHIVRIQYDAELGVVWKPNLNPYTCAITKHGKESKMKGLKSFIAYDIMPSTSNIVVRRRYKHFDWLMQRLEDKFIVTPLPLLPEKQIAGRFQEDFVEHRRNLLQLWLNYITKHPILSQCDVWWHFMSCTTDDERGWKDGKRKAEKDELVGANFFLSVQIDPHTPPLDAVKVSKQLDNFQTFVTKFDDSVKKMFATSVEQSKNFSMIYSKDYKKLSTSIKQLSSAFQSGTAWRNSLGLNEAIRQTGAAYEDISRLFQNEPKYDFEPMADILHQYRGLLSGWPGILQLHKNTVNAKNEQERLFEENKVDEKTLAGIRERANIVTYATLAEINHFHNERLNDFKQMMQVFLTAQINFHSDIVAKLQTALNKINDS